MTSITGAGPLKDWGLPYFDRKHATALKKKEIVDGVLSIPRHCEYANVSVHDVMYMLNNEYSVTIENGIISDHELRLINKRLSIIGFEVDWIGANNCGTNDKIFLHFFVNLKAPLGHVCPCPACRNDESETSQINNR